MAGGVSLQKQAIISAVVGGYGTAIAAAIAVVAVFIALWQIKINRRQARETLAMEAHRLLVQTCFKFPEYSTAEMYAKFVKGCRLKEVRLDEMTVESERYLWFLSLLLNTCEQIIETVCPDSAWDAVVANHLSDHEHSLRFLWPGWRKYYAPALQDRVDQLVSK